MADDEIITFDVSELNNFIKKLCDEGQDSLQKEVETWFDALGIEFLRIIQDEIIRKEVVDTRLLLNSFQKGSEGNEWTMNVDGHELTLEVGTNIKYAKSVNDGHKQKRRFVPGEWKNDKFVYIPNAKTGMMLTEKFVEGKHYFESACQIFEKIFDKSLERKLEEWVAKYDGTNGS